MSDTNQPAPLPEHWRKMFASKWLVAPDLNGKDFKGRIERIDVQEVISPSCKKESKFVVWFAGAKKGWPLPKAAGKVIAAKHGTNPNTWIGKEITIYPTTCRAFGEDNVECIRVRL